MDEANGKTRLCGGRNGPGNVDQKGRQTSFGRGHLRSCRVAKEVLDHFGAYGNGPRRFIGKSLPARLAAPEKAVKAAESEQLAHAGSTRLDR